VTDFNEIQQTELCTVSCYTLFYGSSLSYITYVQTETNTTHKKDVL